MKESAVSTKSTQRYVSRITRDTLAIILAGGQGSRLKELTAWRAKPGVPFGGKFRIIDFPLSNCVNSGIRRIAVVTQYKSHSLIRHIQQGWGHFRGEFGEFVELLPAQQRIKDNWYLGTADAIYQNLDIIRAHDPEYILVLAGDHIYKMDYGAMLAKHVENQADLTVGCFEVPLDDAKAFGVMAVDEQNRVIEFAEKPENPKHVPGNTETALASMGIYIFNRDFLIEQLIKDADESSSSRDFGKDIIPHVVDKYRAYAYSFNNKEEQSQTYWRDVGTIDAFWKANQELIGVSPELNLYDDVWPIWTHQEQLPPAKFVFDDDERRGMAVDSMVSGGCIISGSKVSHSLLFSNVRVNSYSLIEDSVILPEVHIGQRCHIKNAVIDKGTQIPDGTTIGVDTEEDKERFRVTENGIVLVTPDMIGHKQHTFR
ncbi:MAG: glucose-1-phosphate adenylyltransferase [gamma proteobacterium symbiont of Bathyaustriella thionipta]|nr:glucose-1-phosphate adenylyltransferase [gamma proteobacterium symbiont of Bathyaustriella thionipta]MCU7948627.1 glucose-1-phosphate adenylyltransferase [gamma proteobacterium symbiont of Bathyaustriella thionipta]MCU7953033.1 glucose-1-phosphate adenylyltransferase [gamma proteobacterium symbiont of Bathyaustriella thionipta]MCU7955367.1 glucose-1-phosphate adenylyltransferase [gamma proteobacterium symbiont of Bathyaustriella thionipta]MCU7968866.1 glucose-1-phosphate adenylyltransferase 